jgi:hypothetical protein
LFRLSTPPAPPSEPSAPPPAPPRDAAAPDVLGASWQFASKRSTMADIASLADAHDPLVGMSSDTRGSSPRTALSAARSSPSPPWPRPRRKTSLHCRSRTIFHGVICCWLSRFSTALSHAVLRPPRFEMDHRLPWDFGAVQGKRAARVAFGDP